jgi:transketolase
MLYVLWSRHLRVDPSAPQWPNRDRFVLSNGHVSALLYSMLHLSGYEDMPLDELRHFRQLGSKTPGHPERGESGGVEVTTGPLGQGMSNAVGMAIAQSNLEAQFGADLFDSNTYAVVGDGCLQEGVTSEAASLAGHLKLGKLIVLYDDNLITIDGDTSLSFTEDVGKRFEAYGWQVLSVADGNADLAAIDAAIDEAKRDGERPTLIKVRTTIGLGAAKQGTSAVHGSPLAADDLANVKRLYGMDPDATFAVGDDVRARFAERVAQRGAAARAAWRERLANADEAHVAEIERRFDGALPDDWRDALPGFAEPADAKVDATRKMSGVALNALAPSLPELVGGSADLTPSNCTWLECSHDYQPASRDGRYIRFGVREHAMSAIANGIAAYGGFVPYCATFLNFFGYALGAIRLAALSKLRVIYIGTHDSIGLGEDGPTHQPQEMLASLRAMPNMDVWRPASLNEVSAAYATALQKDGPSSICLTRQNVSVLPRGSVDDAERGGYVAHQHDDGAPPAITLVATGSEVGLCVDAANALHARDGAPNVRVVSLPCIEAFLRQPSDYRNEVLPAVPTLSVEAAATAGWASFAHAQLGIDTFGASAPAADVYAHFGLVPDAVADKAALLLAHFADRPCHSPLRLELW